MLGITFVAAVMLIGPGLAVLVDKGTPQYGEEPALPELFGPSRRAFEIHRALA